MPYHDPYGAISAPWRSRYANAVKLHPEDDHTELKRAMRGKLLQGQIQKTLDGEPPLSAEQRAELADLLLTGQARHA